MVRIDLLCLGTGKASTHIYHGEPSTGFVIVQDGEPVLLMGPGLGIVRSCIHYCKKIPDTIYCSHNHTDHTGELPLLLSVEAGKGRRKRVIAEPEVMNRLLNHRLAEYHESINLSNRRLSDLAEFIEAPEEQVTHITSDLSIVPYRSQHSERCYGFLLLFHDQQILGWSADSGFDAEFYAKLSSAPVVVLDARQTGSYDHAGFNNVTQYERDLAAAADASGEQRIAIYVSTYGTQQEMPTVPQALRIGQTLVLFDDMSREPLSPSGAPASVDTDPCDNYTVVTTPRGVPARPQSLAQHGGIKPPLPRGTAPPQPHPSMTGSCTSAPLSPTASRRSSQTITTSSASRSLSAKQKQRSAEIKNFLESMNAEQEASDEGDRSYNYALPGQRSHSLHAIRKFPVPAPGPRKLFIHNNECKGAPPRMFLVKNVRTLEQLKLRVAESLNIKPIRNLYRVDGTTVKTLEELTHMTELVATKHAGAPFDINDLPIHIKVTGLQEP